MKKLSELMREGSQLIPQCRVALYRYNAEDEIDSCCAIGQAYYAATGKFPNLLVTSQAMTELGLQDAKASHPIRPTVNNHLQSLQDVITELNDIDEWETWRIADWLEGIGY